MKYLNGSTTLLALGAIVGIAGVAKGNLAISPNIPSTPYSNVAAGSSGTDPTFLADQAAYQTPTPDAWYGNDYTPSVFGMVSSASYGNVLEMEIANPVVPSTQNNFIGGSNNWQGMNYEIPSTPVQTVSVGLYVDNWANFSAPPVIVGLSGNIGYAGSPTNGTIPLYLTPIDAGIFYLSNLTDNSGYLYTGYQGPGFYTATGSLGNDLQWLRLGDANTGEFNQIGFTTTSTEQGTTTQYFLNGTAVGAAQPTSTELTSMGLVAYNFGNNSNNGLFYFKLSSSSAVPTPSSAAGILEGIGGLAIVGALSLKKKRRAVA